MQMRWTITATTIVTCLLLFHVATPHVDGFLVGFCWKESVWRTRFRPTTRWLQKDANSRQVLSTAQRQQRQRSNKKQSSNQTSTTTSHNVNQPPRRFRNNTKWDAMFHRLRSFRDQHGHSLVPRDYVDQELYTWVRSVRTNYRHQIRSLTQPNKYATREKPRLQLSPTKLEQLNQLGFVWEVKRSQWHERYQELCAFQRQHGHTRVPMNYTVLGVWAANQRRDYQLLQQGKSTKILNDERIRLLQDIQFEWSKSHQDTWQQRYQELQDYVEQNGHANVPEDFSENVALGQWCMNQRTAYRLAQLSKEQDRNNASTSSTSSMTPERIALLEAVGFSWNVLDTNWWNMLQRLKVHHQVTGHLQISTSDLNNMDLRIWLIVQRYQYGRRQENRTSTMTMARIRAIEEAIPNFPWKVRGGEALSTEDWEQLFSAIRAKGIAPGMRPKQHWFEGQNRFDGALKDTWTDEDLLALWHQDEDGGNF